MRNLVGKIAVALVAGGLGVYGGIILSSHYGLGTVAVADVGAEQVASGSSGDGIDLTIKTNRNGQTYGSALGLPDDQWPDLVASVNEHGETGYLRKEDILPGDQPNSPEEAIRMMEEKEARGPRMITVQMLDEEGRTLAGVTKTMEE